MKKKEKRLSAAIVFFTCVILLAALLVGAFALLLTGHGKAGGQEPHIGVARELEAAAGQTFRLNPVFYGKDGVPVPGRTFRYEVSDGAVISQYRGEDRFTVLGEPASGAPQTITVTETKSGCTATVHVKITSELRDVWSASNAPIQTVYGEEFSIEIGTNPANSTIFHDDVSVTCRYYDGEGNEVPDAFEAVPLAEQAMRASSEGNRLRFRATGLGSGKIEISFRNEKRNLDAVICRDVTVSFAEDRLGEALLSAPSAPGLYGKSALGEVERIVLRDLSRRIDFGEVSALPALREIVLSDPQNAVLPHGELPDGCTFYVPEELLSAYSAAWGEDFLRVLPIQASEGTLCAVLHKDYLSERDPEIDCWKDGEGELPQLDDTFNGYRFSGWYTESGELVTGLPAASTHLFARWSKVGYTVTFDAAGSDETFTEIVVDYTDPVPALPVPSFASWRFEGWHVGSIDGERLEAGTSYQYKRSINLVARYEGELTLSDKVAGGDSTLSVVYNKPLERLPAEKPAADGWNFAHWASDTALTQEVSASSPYTGRGDATLYAVRTGTLTLSNNLKTTAGSTAEDTSETCSVTYGIAPAGLPEPQDVATGWTFAGWCQDRADAATCVGKTSPYTGRGDATLYSRWESTFRFRDELHDGTAERTVVRGEAVVLPEPQGDAKGWSFEGWYADNSRLNPMGKLSGEKYFGNGGMEYEARYTAVLSFLDTLHEDLECGGTYTAVYGVPLDGIDALIQTKKDRGWTFQYWSTEKALEAKADSSSPYTGASNAVFYARWTCTINFRDPLNASNDAKTVVFGIVPELPIPQGDSLEEGKIGKNGYIFDFWATASGEKASAEALCGGTAEETLTARWKGELTFIDDLGAGDPAQWNIEVYYGVTDLGNNGENLNARIPVTAKGPWTFGGVWRADLAEDKPLDLSALYTGPGDGVYHAVWTGRLTLSDPKGTESTLSVVFNAPLEAAGLTPPELTVDGWTFAGWRQGAADGGLAYLDPAQPYTEKEELKLYAVRTGTLTFRDDLNGKDYSVKLIYNTCPEGAIESDLPAAPQDETLEAGWEFAGWYHDVLSADEAAFDPAEPYTENGEGAYHARWKGSVSLAGLKDTAAKEIVYGAAPNAWGEEVADDADPEVSDLGWVFDCWTTDEAARAEAFDPEETYTGAGRFTLWPRWKGSITYLNNLSDDGAATEAEIYYSIPFEPLAVEAEEADGWSFAGWYQDRADLETALDPEAVCVGDVHSAQYESRWEGTLSLHDELPYSVSADVQIAVVRGVAPAEIEGHTPVNDRGWSFEGWCLDPASPETRVTESAPYTGKGDAKLTARWTAQMKVDYLGGEPEVPAQKKETIQIVLGQPFGELPASPALQGWEFQGWKVAYLVASRYLTYHLTNDGLVTPEELVDRWNDTQFSGGSDYHKLYAVYTAAITLKASAESEESEEVEVVLRGEISILPEEGADAYKQFRKDGYHYSAWKSEDGSFTLDAAAQADLPAAVAGKTFLPDYLGNTYRYDYEEGEKKAETVALPAGADNVVYGGEAPAAGAASQQGMIFMGWKLSADSKEAILNWSEVQNTVWPEAQAFTFIPVYGEGVSVKLVAQWVQVQFQVSFVAEDDEAWAKDVHTVDYWDGENGGFCAPAAYPRKTGHYFTNWSAAAGVIGTFEAGGSMLQALQEYYDGLEEKPKYDSAEKEQAVDFTANWSALTFAFTFHTAPGTEEDVTDEASYNYGEYAPEGEDSLQSKLTPPADVPGYLNRKSWTASYAEEQTGEEIEDQNGLLAWISSLAAFQYPNGYREGEIDTPDTNGTLAIALQADFDPIQITIEYQETRSEGDQTVYSEEFLYSDIHNKEFHLLDPGRLLLLTNAREESPARESSVDLTDFLQDEEGKVITGWQRAGTGATFGFADCSAEICEIVEQGTQDGSADITLYFNAVRNAVVQFSVTKNDGHGGETTGSEYYDLQSKETLGTPAEWVGRVFQGWKLTAMTLSNGSWTEEFSSEILEQYFKGEQDNQLSADDVIAEFLTRTGSDGKSALQGRNAASLIKLTFTALWTEQTFKLTFIDGYSEQTAEVVVKYSDSTAAFYPIYTPESEAQEGFAVNPGYAFLYWTSDCEDALFAGKKFLNADFRDGSTGFFYLVGEDGAAQSFIEYLQKYAQTEGNKGATEFEITFTAHWQEKMFKIVKQDEAGKTYNRYDAKRISMPYAKLGGFTLETLSEPGFIFHGWKANYDESKYYLGDVIESMRAYADSRAFLLQPTVEVTFTLDWTEKLVKVIRDTSEYGGKIETESLPYTKFLTEYEEQGFLLEAPHLEGYFLEYWEASGSGPISNQYLTPNTVGYSYGEKTVSYRTQGAAADLKGSILGWFNQDIGTNPDLTGYLEEYQGQQYYCNTLKFTAVMSQQTIHIAVQKAADEAFWHGEDPVEEKSLSVSAKYFENENEADWQSFILPKPLRTGYGFDGWLVTWNNGEGAFAEIEAAPYEAMKEWAKGQNAASHFSDVYFTFTPTWTEKEVMLTIETVAGEERRSAEPVSYRYSELQKALETMPTLFSPSMAGYVFKNWTATLGSEAAAAYGPGEPMHTALMNYLDGEIFYFGPKSEKKQNVYTAEDKIAVTLTANYEKGAIIYRVDWDLEGTQNPADIRLEKAEEAERVENASEYLNGFEGVERPQKPGYYFAGWQLTAIVQSAEGYYFRCLCEGCEDCTCTEDGVCGDLFAYNTRFLDVLNKHLGLGAFTATAKAIWKPVAFEVEYFADEGGSGSYKKESSDYAQLLAAGAWTLGGETDRLPAFRRDVYLTGFLLTVANGAPSEVTLDAEVFTADISQAISSYLASLDSYGAEAQESVYIKLEAKWEAREIVVTLNYDDDEGKTETAEQTASEFFGGETSQSVPLPELTSKKGYGFNALEQFWTLDADGQSYGRGVPTASILGAYLEKTPGAVYSAQLVFTFTPVRTEKSLKVGYTGADWLEAQQAEYTYSEIASGEFRLPAHNGYYVLWQSAFSDNSGHYVTYTTSNYADGVQKFTGCGDDLQEKLIALMDGEKNAISFETEFRLTSAAAREITLSYETENGTAVEEETLSYEALSGDAPQYDFRMSVRAGCYLGAWTWEEGKRTLSRGAAKQELARLLTEYADEVNENGTLRISLKANWTERQVVIAYAPNGGSGIETERYSYSALDSWDYAAREKGIYTTYAGYYFTGWTGADATFARGAAKESAVSSLRTYADKLDLAEVSVTLSANWQQKQIKISYGGTSGVSDAPSGSTISYFSTFTLPGAGSKTGYSFSNYSFNGNTYSASANITSALRSYADGRDETTVSVTFTEQWNINYYAIGTSGSNVSISVSANESDKNSAGNYKYGATIKVSVSANDGYKDATYTVKKSDGATIATTNNEFTMPDCNVTIEGSATKKPTCFETGTLIYMADGTKKPIETLSGGDMVLTVNHLTGKVEARPIAVGAHYGEEMDTYEILSLTFDNGTTLKISYEHAFFDMTKNEYVAISVDNVESYLGDTFAYVKQDAFGEYFYESVKLTDYAVTYEWTVCYVVVSMGAWNVIAEGFVSTPSLEGFIYNNVFEFGEGLKYDEQKMQADIDRYGLFTYEEMQGAIPKEVFDALDMKYFKISIAKGQMDPALMEDLFKKYHQYV